MIEQSSNMRRVSNGATHPTCSTATRIARYARSITRDTLRPIIPEAFAIYAVTNSRWFLTNILGEDLPPEITEILPPPCSTNGGLPPNCTMNMPQFIFENSQSLTYVFFCLVLAFCLYADAGSGNAWTGMKRHFTALVPVIFVCTVLIAVWLA